MQSFRILTDALLLHLAQKPLIVLGAVFAACIVATAILVKRALQNKKMAQSPTEDDPCC